MGGNKKRIFLNGRFLTQSITGVQRTALELVKALDRLIDKNIINRNEFEFVLIYSKGNILPISLRHITTLQKGVLKGNLWEQIELPFYTFGKLLLSMGFVSPLFKRKQIVIVHDAGTFSHPHFFKFAFRTWYKFATSVLTKVSLHTITVSQFSKRELIKYTKIKEDKISVIYNSPDHITLYNDPEEDFKKKINRLQPYFLGVSSLHPHKNFEGLADALKKTDLQGYNMIIAGGANLHSFKQVILDKSIIQLGYVSNEELKYLYSKAALFIFPSFFEGFGIPPLEAMLLGCPVLSSTKTALPEVLGDACEYFNPDDTNSLAQKLQVIIKEKDKLNMLRQKGYIQASLYSWQESGKELFRLIKQYA